jgi:hypothetical protein
VWTHTTNKAGHLLTGRISVKLQCTKQLVPWKLHSPWFRIICLNICFVENAYIIIQTVY